MNFKNDWRAFVQQFKQSCLHLFYPTSCLHCHQLLKPQTQILCEECSQLLVLIDPQDCCTICFNVLAHYESSVCQRCQKTPSLYDRLGAAFDYQGPAALLVQHLKYANQPYLAQGMASFLVAQIEQLQWPLPDALVPVPLSRLRWLERGYNQTALIADALAQLIQRPIWNVLRRRSGVYKQAALTFAERQKLTSDHFWLVHADQLQDRVIWVVDDVMTSGITLQRCAEVLSQAGPSKLYGLTFCRTLNI